MYMQMNAIITIYMHSPTRMSVEKGRSASPADGELSTPPPSKRTVGHLTPASHRGMCIHVYM